MSYFLLVAAFGVYLCMVLIGKRHWSGGRDGNAKLAHFLTSHRLIWRARLCRQHAVPE